MRASKAVANIGVVIHGPEVIDSGFALVALNLLEEYGKVTVVLGGTMGRVAAIDACIENRVDISQREPPSQSVKRLQSTMDFVVLLNQAKTRETGLVFGSMVAAKAKPCKPLIQADFGGEFVTVLAGDAHPLAQRLSRNLELELVDLPHPPQPILELPDGAVRRKLKGAMPGENISLNGIVIARALENEVEVVVRKGLVVEIKGAKPKMHGLEKLPPKVDLKTAILRSGDIRRTECTPRSMERSGQEVTLIDHAAENTFEKAKGAGVVITVGDDTTAIAGDILTRLGIPQIGIVDGDLDRLSHRTETPSGSIIIKVRPGFDDVVGRLAKKEIFKGKSRMLLNGRSTEDLVRKVKEIAGDNLLSERQF